MRQKYLFLFVPFFFLSLNANALLITDTILVEQRLANDVGASHVFELIPLGYSPETDSITNIKLIYDFTEIYSEENLGDEDDYPDTDSISWLPYVNEMVTFSSWIFGWRDVHGDIDTGLTIFETAWERSDMCQFMAQADLNDEDSWYCSLNIDVDGTMNAGYISHTDHLWLHSISIEIEVDRRVEVPEPNSALLLGVGLLAIGLLRRYRFLMNKRTRF